MDVPGIRPEYSQDQPWISYYGCTVPNGPMAGLANSPSPPYHWSNPGPLTRPLTINPGPPPPTGGLVPSSPSQQPGDWVPSQQHCNGIYTPVPKATEPLSQPSSPAESPRSESRYGLDPRVLPSAVHVMNEDRAEWEGRVFGSEPKSLLPPLSTTDCPLVDRGNAIPRFIRLTTYCFPANGQNAQQSHLPLGAIVCPLARSDREEALPVCKAGECVRGCGGCGAFMCPAMTWQDCGQRFYCPFCGKLNEVPWQFYQPANSLGVRVDREKRPELSFGSYEILEADKGNAAVLIFAVDVSTPAVTTGQLDLVCLQICSLLENLNCGEEAVQSDLRVGLMTYDSRIHLYDLSPELSRPHMLVITDTENLELPVREGLLVPLKDCCHIMKSVLQEIPQFSGELAEASGSQELPVSAGIQILQAAGCYGKLLVFHSSPVTESTNHKSSGFFGSGTPKSIFQPPESAVSLANMCVTQGCSVDMFVFTQQDMGGAWPGNIAYLTGGGLFCYGSLQSEVEGTRFSYDLRKSVEMKAAYRAHLQVFASKELHVSACYGPYTSTESRCVPMAALDRHTAFAFEFSHSKPLDESRGAAIQVALSYGTPDGRRKTCVHSLTLRCSRHLLDTFRNSQAEALLTFYCKKMFCAVLERPLQSLREGLQTEVTEALACYRKHCSTSSVSPGQLVLPQFLKVLPVYVNSLRKSEILLPGLRSSVHQRLQLRSLTVAMDTRSTANHFYPLILPLSVCGDEVIAASMDQAVRCTADSLDPGGLYLASCPLSLLLWVGRDAPSLTLRRIFSVACFSSVPAGEIILPELENPLSVSVRSLIDTLQLHSPQSLTLKVVRQGDSCEEDLQRLLVEDKSPNGGASYADFLYHLHVNTLRLLV